jgi:arylsulfatase A-like enzyme
MSINVLFIVIDCLRADHCSCYGYERETTPSIDNLAKEGVLARRAVTQSTFTVASAASMLTSLYPEVHGAIGFRDRFPGHLVTLPDYLSRYGFDTVCFEGMNAFSGPWGLGRGFNMIESFKQEKQSRKLDRARADEICCKFVEFVADHECSERPFFALIWFGEAHDPSLVPEEQGRYFQKSKANAGRMDQYDGAIRYVDHYIGEIVQSLYDHRLLDSTFIVVTGDHGDIFDEHYWLEGRLIADLVYRLPLSRAKRVLDRNGYLDHLGVLPYEGVIRVPLIFRFPQNRYKGEIGGLTELLDLFPTTLDLLKLKVAKGSLQGRSIIPDLEGRHNRKQVAFTHTKPTKYDATFTCATDDEWKFVEICRPEASLRNMLGRPKSFLANTMWSSERLLKVGTSEKKDFSREYPGRLQTLKEELELWRRSNRRRKEGMRLSKAISRVKERQT